MERLQMVWPSIQGPFVFLDPSPMVCSMKENTYFEATEVLKRKVMNPDG
jgi:hypothetical protein